MNGDLAAQIQEEGAYTEAFLQLYAADELEGDAVIGIAAQAEAGERELSERQMEVIRDVVDQFMGSHGCDVCGECELDDFPSILDDGMCGRHSNEMDKDD